MKHLSIIVLAVMGLFVVSAFAQKPTENTMKTVREAMQAQKRAFVAVNMQLTQEEEAKFWPIYDEYQKELQTINTNLAEIVKEYANEYDTLTDEKAKKLTKRYLTQEENLISLRKSYLKKFTEAIPAKKAARYYQIENKIHAVIRYDLAENIPLMK